MICSFENDFVRHRNELKSWFLNRVSSKTLVDTEVSKTKFLNTSGDKKNYKKRNSSSYYGPSTAQKILLKLLRNTCILCIWMMKLKQHLLQLQQFHFGEHGSWIFICWWRQNSIPKKDSLDHLNVMVSVVKYAWMWQKATPSLAQLTRKSM